MWQWWKCDNDVPEDYTDYHLNYDDGDGDDYWNDDDGDKWKILCWLSDVQVLLLPPVVSDFFPTMLVMLNNVSGDVTLLALSVIVVMDAPSTLSATDKLPLYDDWISFARSSISCLLWATLTSWLYWPLINKSIKWNITRILSYRKNFASCQKVFLSTTRRSIMLTTRQLPSTNKHFRNERLGKKCPQRCKKNWSPEKGVSHQEWQEVSDPSVIPSFYQLNTEGKPCQWSRCQHSRCYF